MCINDILIKSETPQRLRADELTYEQRRDLLYSMDKLVVVEVVPSGFGAGASWRREEEA
jgi:hypothetical protein